MSISIKLDWDEDGLRRAIEEAAQPGFDQRVTELQQKVQGMTCPTHGAHPNVVVAKHASLNSQVRVGGFCCQEFADRVGAAMAMMARRNTA